LCFTASPAMRERIAGIGSALSLPLTPIGSITVDSTLVITTEDGTPLAALPPAFDHFH